MRRVNASTGAKLRFRGRGSGHFEVVGPIGNVDREAPVNLMLAVSVDKLQPQNFLTAVQECIQLLDGLTERYHYNCRVRGIQPQPVLYRLDEMSPLAVDVLADVTADQERRVPAPPPRRVPPRFSRPQDVQHAQQFPQHVIAQQFPWHVNEQQFPPHVIAQYFHQNVQPGWGFGYAPQYPWWTMPPPWVANGNMSEPGLADAASPADEIQHTSEPPEQADDEDLHREMQAAIDLFLYADVGMQPLGNT